MFYSQFILAKKGPLGTIWIAAHLERKLRKNQVADTDIGVSVDSILFPEIPIALRLSSHLLLGVVRIYSRKVNYLFDDCSETLLKVKQAFRSTAVDLPPEESTAPYHSITLPETFDLDDFELPDSDLFQSNYVDHHVSTREQITLQDTMEGVVYSTTQFGLDERFGDGDTSGLDLDEELFLNKVKTSGHVGNTSALDDEPDATMQRMTSTKQEDDHKGINGNIMLDDLDEDNDTAGYAQAPSTPGLLEEPNLSIAQEASVCCDDYQELGEDPNTPRLPVEENLATRNSDLCNGQENTATAMSNGQKIENHLNSLANSPSSLVWIPSSDELAVEEAAVPPGFEFPSANSDALVDAGANGLQKQSYGGVVAIDYAPPSAETGNISDKSCLPFMGQQLGCETLEINNQTPLEQPQASNGGNIENAGNLEKSCHLRNSVSTSVDFPLFRGGDDFENPEKVEVADTHVLQPCKHLNQSSLGIPEVDVQFPGINEEAHLPESTMGFQALNQEDTTQLASCEDIQLDFRKWNDRVDNVISIENQLDNSNGNEITELPATEKLLSLPPGGHGDERDHLLESTPNREYSVIGEADNVGINIFSGKKRSFTESTLTVDSLNSVESFGVVQSKRTKESIPDDNDLLSSILDGRKSSVLKMKPTPLPLPPPPPPQETTNKKRPRSTARISSSKKKVLVDDTMVLHGDIIREQLTNTEDIRRLRKKAPCTRSEIWMIQREFFEEEIFTKPLLTGFSSVLASMYSQTCDLSEIKLFSLEGTQSNEEKTSEMLLPHVSNGETNNVAAGNPCIADGEAKLPAEAANILGRGSEDDVCGVQLEDASSDKLHGGDQTLETQNVEIDGEFPLDIVTEVAGGVTSVENGAANMLTADDDMQRQHTSEDRHDPSLVICPETERSGGDQVSGVTAAADEHMVGVFSKIDDQIDGVVNKVEITELDLDGTYNPLEPPAEAASPRHVEQVNFDVKSASLNDREEANHHILVDAENAFPDHIALADDGDFAYKIDGHDTGFLNDDDDDIVEEGEDCMPSTEHTGFSDNSGWSSRTRAVAKYLQMLFDKEAEQGRKAALPMNNLLFGKSRKEASRMFFEALVLKTRDYIHVEQEAPFENISMQPQMKLMKADF